jgi:hypothetical protein
MHTLNAATTIPRVTDMLPVRRTENSGMLLRGGIMLNPCGG